MPKYECGICGESNVIANTRCTRCGQILPWSFLHDPSLVVTEKVKTPFWVKWLDTILNPNNEPPKCRYCGEGIAAEALICPHCRRILMVRIHDPIGPRALGGFIHGVAFDGGGEFSRSPEGKVLIQRFLADYPNGY